MNLLVVSSSAATDVLTYRIGAWVLVLGDGVSWWSSPSYGVWFVSIGDA